MKYTAHQFNKVLLGLKNGSRTAAATGTPVDVRGYSEALIIVTAGTFLADASVVIGVIEGPTLTACTGVISGASFDAIVPANDNQQHVARLDLRKRDRYLNIKTAVANSTGHVAGVVIVLSGAKNLPTGQTAVFDI